ncbi:hypothetical protein CPB83DRAFT_894800 [Crepidotus variabilis]|uniref:Uncharacterized protein n=1 Tax=Crepidotus variabilis TaxID=179855 RepID=A0A9P6EF99_9AGAR|nr:hypothetical protein CPB83DRAFT_894800 [Crepidotus variabilis]
MYSLDTLLIVELTDLDSQAMARTDSQEREIANAIANITATASANAEGGAQVVDHEKFAKEWDQVYTRTALGGSSSGSSSNSSIGTKSRGSRWFTHRGIYISQDQESRVQPSSWNTPPFRKGSQISESSKLMDALLGVERFDAGCSDSPEAKAIAHTTPNANANTERGMQVVNFEEFANVNGMEEQLLLSKNPARTCQFHLNI